MDRIQHLDLYRLNKEKPSDFIALDLGFTFKQGISLVEWPVRLPESMVPQNRLDIEFTIVRNTQPDEYGTFDSDLEERILVLTPNGLFWEELIQNIVHEGYFDDLQLS